MRILYYSPHPELHFQAATGYGRHMREMVDAFRQMGHEVALLIAGGEEDLPARKPPSQKKAAIRKMIPSLAWQTSRDLALLRFDRRMELKLKSKIAEFKPDFVYERVAYMQASGIRACTHVGVFHFAEVNAPFPEERQYFSGKSLLLGLSRKIEREIFMKSNAVSVVSSALRDYAIRMSPAVKDKIQVIPNAVNPQSLSTELKGALIREKLGVKDEIIVGFVGSIFAYHGVDLLIEAFAKLPKHWSAKLLIVGDGTLIPDLKVLATTLGIAEAVHFTGGVPYHAVQDHIDAMDICCMTKSNWYGSPVKIFEYALLAKATLAPNVSPVRDVMTELDGRFCEPTVEAIAEKLLELIENKEFRVGLGLHWQQKVLKEYTWAAAAQKVIEACT